jgi:hypothetical protein
MRELHEVIMLAHLCIQKILVSNQRNQSYFVHSGRDAAAEIISSSKSSTAIDQALSSMVDKANDNDALPSNSWVHELGIQVCASRRMKCFASDRPAPRMARARASLVES